MTASRFLLALLAGALSFTSVPLVHGTTVRYLMPDDLIRGARRIFHGTCTDVQSFRDDANRIVTRYTFTVHETLKGKVDSLQRFTLYGGRYRGLQTVIPGLSQYRRGDEVVLFLGPVDPGSGLCFPVGLDQGLFRVTSGEGGKKVSRSLDQLHLVAPRTGRPGRFPVRADLDAFKRFVRDRVAAHRKNR